jgi:hypothetical protein
MADAGLHVVACGRKPPRQRRSARCCDICAVGQTVAAHDLCSKLRPYLKRFDLTVADRDGIDAEGRPSMGENFKKDIATVQPRVLLVAPLSGHFSTLQRATVRTMLPDNDVFITDWHNARDVPLTAGRFGIDEYTDHLINFLEVMGPGAHGLAVCQPCVSVLTGRGDGASRQSGAAALDDADGRADRHADQSDQGQRARQEVLD